MAYVFAGISFGFAALTYYFQRKAERDADLLRRVPFIKMEDLLPILQATDDRRIPYCAFQGKVTCDAPLLTPHERHTEVVYYKVEVSV